MTLLHMPSAFLNLTVVNSGSFPSWICLDAESKVFIISKTGALPGSSLKSPQIKHVFIFLLESLHKLRCLLETHHLKTAFRFQMSSAHGERYLCLKVNKVGPQIQLILRFTVINKGLGLDFEWGNSSALPKQSASHDPVCLHDNVAFINLVKVVH